MREIDITKQMVVAIDLDPDQMNEVVVATYELWFDVDKYFATKTSFDDETWINFYTFWNPKDNSVTAEYVLEGMYIQNAFDWPLTKEEQDFFRSEMEDFCKSEYGKTLTEFWKENS